ncbi:hypothetical protein PV326_001765 [Microctonus aethiopoides]|nr:hypothetical protein PV326_001765 [Microctonus aethiopoides]
MEANREQEREEEEEVENRGEEEEEDETGVKRERRTRASRRSGRRTHRSPVRGSSTESLAFLLSPQPYPPTSPNSTILPSSTP